MYWNCCLKAGFTLGILPVIKRYTEDNLIQIESGVVFPSHRSMYPFAEMLPGDSFLLRDRKKADSARVASIRFV